VDLMIFFPLFSAGNDCWMADGSLGRILST